MAISDKTRKILWGRSGSRCAICRRALIIDATGCDDESIIGEECHIISSKANGPRYSTSFLNESIDDQKNLILLCRIHHKLIDDQQETYTVEKLKKIKSDHEEWVSSNLAKRQKKQLRVIRIKENIPKFLARIDNGSSLYNIIDGAYCYEFQHDDLKSEFEVEMIADFLQELQDYVDLSGFLESGEKVKAKFRIGELLNNIEEHGFLLFGAREIRILEGGVGDNLHFPTAIIFITRHDNPIILKHNDANPT
ncbi:HNH endonuclease signature motif containing protein [Desulfovibrio aminophilus]|uniref:HNH endonuclease signature motif containing protein n=1 Tax=Desulfovibrio aminophilus TaxID=81425 RepID=UPI0009FCF9B7|nr:HNH endonuclease signature motif containing protein [Desulfovibrio aminophilus]